MPKAIDQKIENIVAEIRARAYKQGWHDAMKELRRRALEVGYDCPLMMSKQDAERIGISNVSDWTRDDDGNLMRIITR